MTLKKIAIGGGLGLCLLLGMLMYHNKLTRQEVLDVDLWKDSLCESKKQSGYPAKNFGVSLSNENVMLLGAKSFEFEIKNESNRKWYWDETFIVNGLEINLDGIWYQIPVKDENGYTFNLMEYPLPPGDTMTVFLHPDFYQNMIPGNYRYTILIYDHEDHSFNVSSEFTVVEKE